MMSARLAFAGLETQTKSLIGQYVELAAAA
jgi:hypothetical protein